MFKMMGKDKIMLKVSLIDRTPWFTRLAESKHVSTMYNRYQQLTMLFPAQSQLPTLAEQKSYLCGQCLKSQHEKTLNNSLFQMSRMTVS